MRVDPLRATLTVYAAILLGPVPVTAIPGWPSFALGAVLGGVIGAIVVRRMDLPEAILTLPRTVIGFTLPLVWLIGAGLQAGTPTAFFLSPLFGGSLAAPIWLVAVIIAIETRKQARLDAMETAMTFEARLPPTQRRQLRLAVGALAGVVAVAIVVLLAVDADVSWSAFVWLPGMIPVWLLTMRGGTARTVRIADVGLVVEQSIQDWETIRGAEVTAEALVVRRAGWYRPSLAFDCEDLDDSDAVVAAIAERARG